MYSSHTYWQLLRERSFEMDFSYKLGQLKDKLPDEITLPPVSIAPNLNVSKPLAKQQSR
jgi:hypothetical protein